MTSPKLCCPFCSQFESRVVETRAVTDNRHVWRRRQCEHCGKRFTTQEAVVGHYEKQPRSSSNHYI
jgi:transcriptional regulator NrdR family protein